MLAAATQKAPIPSPKTERALLIAQRSYRLWRDYLGRQMDAPIVRTAGRFCRWA